MRFVLAWSRSAEISRSRCTIATLSPVLPRRAAGKATCSPDLLYARPLCQEHAADRHLLLPLRRAAL